MQGVTEDAAGFYTKHSVQAVSSTDGRNILGRKRGKAPLKEAESIRIFIPQENANLMKFCRGTSLTAVFPSDS